MERDVAGDACAGAPGKHKRTGADRSRLPWLTNTPCGNYSFHIRRRFSPWEEEQMTGPTTIGKEMQEQLLETIRKSQEAVTNAIRTWADVVHSVTPSLPIPSAPLADKMPKPGDLVANAYDFAEQLLAAQRKFAEDVLQAVAPVLGASEESGSAKKSSAGAK